jgi:hypothetical protein
VVATLVSDLLPSRIQIDTVEEAEKAFSFFTVFIASA